MPRRPIHPSQARLLPTAREQRAARKATAERGKQGAIRCFTCRGAYSPAIIAPHPDTGMECCASCKPIHERHYNAYLDRHTRRLAREVQP